MKSLTIPIVAGVIVAVWLLSASLFTVDQTERVLVVQFGEVVRSIDEPGLYVKVPLIQSVISFDKRLLAVELPGEEVILGDQRRLIVDSFTVYRIANPLRFYQAVGPVPDLIRTRLNSIVTASLRQVLGRNTLVDVLSADRERIMTSIKDLVGTGMENFGVSIEDVRIRRADLPPENTQAILSRMQSERQRVAAQARAEGAEASAKIRAEAERERTVILAEAKATAEKTRGDGEAQATSIFAKSFSQDPQFFSIWRTFQGYRDVFDGGNARLVLTPENDYLRYLQSPPSFPGQSPNLPGQQPSTPGQPPNH
jgi:membrane protease subunit HflC